MDRKTFVFYKEWKDAVKDLPDSIRLELYEGIMEYAFAGSIPELSPMAQIAFNFVRPALDRDTDKYTSIADRNRANGASGGRPKKQTQNIPQNPVGYLETQNNPENPTSCSETQNNPNNPVGYLETQGNPKNLVNVYDNDNDINSPVSPPFEGDAVATAPAAGEPSGKGASSGQRAGDEQPDTSKGKDWRNDYETYLELTREALAAIRGDPELLERQRAYYPGVNILLSLDKALDNFWATPAGWKNKKKSRSKEIDMKQTLINAIAKNRVFSNETEQKQGKRYDNGDFLR